MVDFVTLQVRRCDTKSIPPVLVLEHVCMRVYVFVLVYNAFIPGRMHALQV